MGLNLNLFKRYDTNAKHAKTQKIQKMLHRLVFVFLQNRKATEIEKLAFCVITFEAIRV